MRPQLCFDCYFDSRETYKERKGFSRQGGPLYSMRKRTTLLVWPLSPFLSAFLSLWYQG
jgi:hypothetical protein